MILMNPYLNFNGNTEEAFLFYKSVFGTDFNMLMRMNEAPPMPGMPALSEEDGKKIMHVSMPIGKENYLMGSDTLEAFGHEKVQGNNTHLSLHLQDEAEATRLFSALSEGGTVTMPLSNTFWAKLFGTCTDKFGIQWIMNVDHAKQS